MAAGGALPYDRAAGVLNGPAEGAVLERVAALDAPGRALLTRAAEARKLSARGWARTLRLARTIADLEAVGAIQRVHWVEALIYRRVAAGQFAVPVKA